VLPFNANLPSGPSDQTLLVLAFAALLPGLALLIVGLRWDRAKGRARCKRCWYALVGSPSPGGNSTTTPTLPITCPECGLVLTRATQLFATRPLRWLVWLGAVLLTVASLAGGARLSRKPDAWRAMPGGVLFGAFGALAASGLAPSALLSEATRRVLIDPVSPGELARFARMTSIGAQASVPRAIVAGLPWPTKETACAGVELIEAQPFSAFQPVLFLQRAIEPAASLGLGPSMPPTGESSALWSRPPVKWHAPPSRSSIDQGSQPVTLTLLTHREALSVALEKPAPPRRWTIRLPVLRSIDDLMRPAQFWPVAPPAPDAQAAAHAPARPTTPLLDALKLRLIHHPTANAYALLVGGLDGTGPGDAKLRRELAMGLRLDVLAGDRVIATARWAQQSIKPGEMVLAEPTDEAALVEAMNNTLISTLRRDPGATTDAQPSPDWPRYTIRLTNDDQLAQLAFEARKRWVGVESAPLSKILR
jgi:hypothetical protein